MTDKHALPDFGSLAYPTAPPPITSRPAPPVASDPLPLYATEVRVACTAEEVTLQFAYVADERMQILARIVLSHAHLARLVPLLTSILSGPLPPPPARAA